MKIDLYLGQLETMPLFENLKEEISEIIKGEGYAIKKYKKNRIIYLQHEKCTTIDIILEGLVLVQKQNYDGSIMTIAKFGKNDTIGENLLFSKKSNYPLTIIAKKDAVLMHLKQNLILKLCQRDRIFLIEMLRLLSEKTQILAGVINSVARESIRECITSFLEYEVHKQNSKIVKLSCSKKELAESFGIQRTSLSRELNKMKKEGLIDFDRKTIRILEESIITNEN
ncbi:MAG: Crp/Fnr family transcriptional regulator [Alkaliphilus sp.]